MTGIELGLKERSDLHSAVHDIVIPPHDPPKLTDRRWPASRRYPRLGLRDRWAIFTCRQMSERLST